VAPHGRQGAKALPAVAARMGLVRGSFFELFGLALSDAGRSRVGHGSLLVAGRTHAGVRKLEQNVLRWGKDRGGMLPGSTEQTIHPGLDCELKYGDIDAVVGVLEGKF
jgi:hypothetical protein